MKTMTLDNPIRDGLKRLLKTLLAPASIAVLASTSAQAASLSDESFSGYTPGTLLSAESPAPTVAGYTGNWSDGLTQQTYAGSLAYGDVIYVPGTGNQIGVPASDPAFWWNGGETVRALDSSLTVTSTTTGTRYLSWLFQSDTQAQYQMLLLNDGGTAEANRKFGAGLSYSDEGGYGAMPNGGVIYDYEVNGSSHSTGVTATTTVNLFVVKFELSDMPGADKVTVWLNPTLGLPGDPPGGMVVDTTNITFDRLVIADYGSNPANWDEIRWGTTFNDVTNPSPPPQARIHAFGPGATIAPVVANAAAITWNVPYGTNVAALPATFTLDLGATCTVNGNPVTSGSIQNFTSPVDYVVKSSDNLITNTYSVTVEAAPANSACNITAFGTNVAGSSVVIEDTTFTTGTVVWTVPFGTTVASLAPSYTLSAGATCIQPNPGTPTPALSTTTPVPYVVHAEDGFTSKTYDVTVVVTPGSSACDITAYGTNVAGSSAVITTTSSTTGTVVLAVPFGTNVASLAPSYTLSAFATCTQPNPGTPTPALSTTTPVPYVVHAQDGTTKTYDVTVTFPAFEPFSGYTVGTLLSAENPAPTVAGYTGNWYGGQSQTTYAGSLAYGDVIYAAGTGDHVEAAANDPGVIWYQGGGEMTRNLDSSLTVTPTTTGTRYLSWLFKSSTYAQYQMLLLNQGGARTFGAGLSYNDGDGSTYDYQGPDTIGHNTGVTATTAVNLFVVKFELSATTGQDQVTVWLNPVLGGSGDPTGGMVLSGTDLTFDNLRLADYGADPVAWDEIRWGTTFNDVVNPSPGPQARILAFGPGATIGPVAANAAAISWTVPYGSNLAALAPTFTLSDGATCTVNGNSAASGSSQNFTTNPVHYIVKASDFATSGITTDYAVTVTVGPFIPPPPGGVTGLALWLDASAPETMTLDGTTVNEWRGRLGSTAKMTRTNGAPTVVASGIGGIPTVHFSASSMGDGVNHAAPVTIFFVSRQTGGTNQRVLSGGNNWLLGYHGGNKGSAYFEGWVNQSGTPSDTNPHLYATTIGGSGQNSTVWAEGAQIASNQNGTQGPNGLFVGGGGAYNEYSNCDISEVLVYHRILNSTELNAVGGYLTYKYGLTTSYPPVTTPYSIWATTNGATGQTPDQDHDNDGVENGIEYFMGQTGSSFTAMPGLDGSNTVTWTKDPAYNGTYEVQTSPDLGTWTNVVPKPLPSGGNLSYTLPTGLGKQFVRLLVTPAP